MFHKLYLAEISQLIFNAYQLNKRYMIGTLVSYELTKDFAAKLLPLNMLLKTLHLPME